MFLLRQLNQVIRRAVWSAAAWIAASSVCTAPIQAAEKIDVLVFCPPAAKATLQPWLQHRQQQGHQVQLTDPGPSAESIRNEIRRIARDHALRYVILVGDVPGEAVTNQADGSFTIPTKMVDAKVNVQWGSEPTIPSDNWLADLDDDQIPDLAIARWPVSNVPELKSLVDRILRYELDPSEDASWQRRINLVAGVGGFGALADAVLETAARSFITGGIPAEYQTSMTYASWRSPYCPDPRSFRNVTLDRLNEGCLFWVYIGHGHRTGLDWIQVPAGVAPILRNEDVPHVQSTNGSPIAIFLSCYAGAVDDQDDCLAERLLLQDQGPVAVIAGSRVTMPYAMTLLTSEMLDEYFVQRTSILGDLVLNAKRKMALDQGKGFQRRLVTAIAKAISPNPNNLLGERIEHLHLFNLFGDPLLRIRQAKAIKVKSPLVAAPGEEIEIEVASDVMGPCVIELACRRGDFVQPIQRRKDFENSDAFMALMNDIYALANQDCFHSHQCRLVQMSEKVRIRIPEDAVNSCVIRCFAQNGTECSVGATVITVRTVDKRDDSVDSHLPALSAPELLEANR